MDLYNYWPKRELSPATELFCIGLAAVMSLGFLIAFGVVKASGFIISLGRKSFWV